MWTSKNRGRYDRSALRYPSDLTDDEWALIEPLIPPARRGGDKRHVDEREVMNGIMYVLSTGCCPCLPRVSTMILVPTEPRQAVEMLTVDPLDLQVAQDRDVAAHQTAEADPLRNAPDK